MLCTVTFSLETEFFGCPSLELNSKASIGNNNNNTNEVLYDNYASM